MRVKKILVVEDEVNIALTLSRGLQQGLGKQVWVEICHSAETALYALYLKDFDVLITDQNLPGISGTALISKARQITPSLRAVLITGVPSEELEISTKKNSTLFVTKPFQLASFVSLVNDIVNKDR